MIKCKEDLYNTYIVNDFGELCDKYIAACKKFGTGVWSTNTVKLKYIYIENTGDGVMSSYRLYPDSKQITLADFEEDKPMIDLRGTKIDLRKPDGSVDEEKSRAFQEMCFAQGINWADWGKDKVQLTDSKFLFADKVGLGFSNEFTCFNTYHKYKQIDIIPHTTWEVVPVQPEKSRKTITVGGKTFYEDELISRCEGLQEVK